MRKSSLRPGTRTHAKPCLDLVINRKPGLSLDRDCYPVSHGTILAAGVFLAPHLQGEMAILYERDGRLPIKVLSMLLAVLEQVVPPALDMQAELF
jgi:hypothetical protein